MIKIIRYAKIPDNLSNIGVEQIPPVALEDGTNFYGLKFIPLKAMENPNYNNGQPNETGTIPSKTVMVKDDSKNIYYDEITQEIMDKKEQKQVIQDLQNGKYATSKNLMQILGENAQLKMENQNLQQMQMKMLSEMAKLKGAAN